MPIYNWFKIQDTGIYQYVIKEGNEDDINVLANKWNEIYADFIDTFGINEDFQMYLEMQRDLEVLNIDLAITGDRSLNTFINIKRGELSALANVKEKRSFNEGKVYVEKYMGFKLDEKITTVKDYYTYIYTIEKTNKIVPKNG